MRWILLLLVAAAPCFPGDEDEDGDESAIEVESEEPEADQKPDDATPAAKKKSTAPKATGKGELVLLQDSRKIISIRVPDTWIVKEVASNKATATFEVRLPGSNGSFGTLGVDLPPDQRDPRGLPAAMRASMAADDSIVEFRIESRALPHAVYRQKRDGRTDGVVYATQSDRGNTIHVSLAVPENELDAIYEAFLASALTVATTRPPWPQIPEPYEITTTRGLRYAVHPSVEAPTKHFMAVTKATQKRFEKQFGKLPGEPRGTPEPVVFLHRSNEEARALAPWLGENLTSFITESSSRRFWATPVQDDDEKGTLDLASAFGGFLVVRRYGYAIPLWVRLGESNAARVEQTTGKRLPWIAPGHRPWSDGLELSSLAGYEDPPTFDDRAGRQAFFYVAFFHAGGSKYSRAYRNFLEDTATHYDAVAAAQRHLEPLGYDKLRSAATKFMLDGLKIVKE